MWLAGIPVADRAVLHLATSLREAELVDTAELLEGAYDREARIVALDVTDREAILRVLKDAPEELLELNLLVSGQRGVNGTSDLYLLSADGRRRRNLTRSLENEFGGAAWSPDQRRIAFVRVAGGGMIHVINTDGSGQRSRVSRRSPLPSASRA